MAERIAERLRFYAEYGMTLLQKGGAAELAREAADELDRLQARERQMFIAGFNAAFDSSGYPVCDTPEEAYAAYLAKKDGQ